ncbi:hypothetical protein Bra5_CH04308 [Rhizobium phaseoli Brasil 5]|nr:hypothetical protein Bra5_CH04308 [Rhizobium phaseoli Brasil 5]
MRGKGATDRVFLSPAEPGRERQARDVRRFSSSFWPWFWQKPERQYPPRQLVPGHCMRQWRVRREPWRFLFRCCS